MDSILNLDEERVQNYVVKEERLKEVKHVPEEIDAFINSLQTDLIYDYPNEINVIQYFNNNKAITGISLNEFLTNIKIITALNQNKRLYYTIEQEKGEEGKEEREREKKDKRIILSHPIDTDFNFELCTNLFKLVLDLPDNEEFFFSYIFKWVHHDSEVDTYKLDKDLPDNDSDFFKGSIISQDYMNYIKNHPEYKEDYLRSYDTYRRTLLKFSDHPKRGKYGLLIFKPKKKSDLNTPNEYCLNRNYYIDLFKYSEEKYHYLNEYYNFCAVLEENKEKLRINLEKSTFPCLDN